MISSINKKLALRVVSGLVLKGEGETVSEIVERSVLQALELKDEEIRKVRDRLEDDVLHVFIDAKNKQFVNWEYYEKNGHHLDRCVCTTVANEIDNLRPQVLDIITNQFNKLT